MDIEDSLHNLKYTTCGFAGSRIIPVKKSQFVQDRSSLCDLTYSSSYIVNEHLDVLVIKSRKSLTILLTTLYYWDVDL